MVRKMKIPGLTKEYRRLGIEFRNFKWDDEKGEISEGQKLFVKEPSAFLTDLDYKVVDQEGYQLQSRPDYSKDPVEWYNVEVGGEIRQWIKGFNDMLVYVTVGRRVHRGEGEDCHEDYHYYDYSRHMTFEGIEEACQLAMVEMKEKGLEFE